MTVAVLRAVFVKPSKYGENMSIEKEKLKNTKRQSCNFGLSKV